ncbi:MAG: hypothetical protein ACE5EB_07795 [Thermodesulfobacteriota bacterium]
MRKFLILLFLIFIPDYGFSKTIHRERLYQESWCDRAGGLTEVTLSDFSRVDCLTDEYAVEMDFARKWAEAVGQALFYGSMTGRRPAIVLILENDGDRRYLKRLYLTIEKWGLPVRVWTTGPGDLK